jgi:hypothetical protein
MIFNPKPVAVSIKRMGVRLNGMQGASYYCNLGAEKKEKKMMRMMKIIISFISSYSSSPSFFHSSST